MKAEAGTLTVLIGPSGSGKSTLLRVIAKLESSDNGTIDRPDGDVGLVFQEPSLWPHLSLVENVSLPLRVIAGMDSEKAYDIARGVLNSWGLEKRLEAFPSELSGGQQQRGAVARSIVMNPKVLCLDEITASLDPEITGEILSRLLALKNSERTIVLWATHQISFAKEAADHVIFMDQGRIVEQGTATEVFGNPQQTRTRIFLEAAKLS